MHKKEMAQPIGPLRTLLAIALLGACVYFIWSNSLLSPAASARRSDAVAAFLTRVLGGMLGDRHRLVLFIQGNVRKIAHALEFFILGATCVLLLLIIRRLTFQMLLNACFFLLAVAVTDEAIQLFTGRGAMVKDILLDCAGGFSGLLLALLLHAPFALSSARR